MRIPAFFPFSGVYIIKSLTNFCCDFKQVHGLITLMIHLEKILINKNEREAKPKR